MIHFRQLIIRLWSDRRGATSPVAVILLTTIIGIGATVGLVTFRDQVVQEFGDVAVALQLLDQSYELPNGVVFKDYHTHDNTETGVLIVDPEDSEPNCLNVQRQPSPEGTVLAPVPP